jgi:hypothetical protein
MRIAFDLDGTVVPSAAGQFPAWPSRWPWRAFFRERLRDDTIALMRELRGQGHEIWIYTSSLRPSIYVRLWFLSCRVRLSGVINAETQLAAGLPRDHRASKFPPAFGIDLLVDDSVGVESEGRLYGFSVVRVDPGDRRWANKVREVVCHTV